MEDKAYTHIFNDILVKVLQFSENPSQFGEYLTQQIRELVGARTIVITVKVETEPSEIFSVYPVRRTGWANQCGVLQLADISQNFETIHYLDSETSEENISKLLKQLEIDKVIVIPLIAATRKIGTILLLDIMDLFGIESVIDLLNRLSGVFALVIRNSHLYQNMEDLVAIRTQELQKRNDELVEALRRAEESDRLKKAFLQNISHEIRTPMNSIIGFSDLLNKPSLLPEKRKLFTDIISKSSHQLLTIINDIISISTIESGQEKVKEKEININSILRHLNEQFQLVHTNKNVILTLKPLIPDDEVNILSDETKLIQILSNVIFNALKFTKQGFINFGYNVKGNEIEFYVEDSGIGIPANMHTAIFNRFRQVDGIAQQFGGSGLGLSISKAYVELLGGKMWLESELGKGTTFYFTIPLKKAQKNSTIEFQYSNDLKIENRTPKTILIAEDEDSNFFLLEELLSDLNITIIRAINGLEAVDICKSHNGIDLILMDIKMPLMNGDEAAKQIKILSPKLPIIAQTAYSTDGEKTKILECCDDFISKPLKKELLLAKIIKQIERT